MKKLYKYIMILFVGIVALSSCVDDNDVFNVGEGKDVVLKLKVQTQANKDIVLGRAEVNENNLSAIHLYDKFSFDKLGIRKKYYDGP